MVAFSGRRIMDTDQREASQIMFKKDPYIPTVFVIAAGEIPARSPLHTSGPR